MLGVGVEDGLDGVDGVAVSVVLPHLDIKKMLELNKVGTKEVGAFYPFAVG